MEIKKSEKAGLEKWRTTFFLLGIVLSSAVMLVAFNWKSKAVKTEILENGMEWVEVEKIPVTKKEEPRKVKPKPRKKAVEIKIVNNHQKTNEELLLLPDDFDGLDSFVDTSDTDVLEDKVPWVPFPSHSAEFPGNLREYLAKNIRYSPVANEMGCQGTVYIYFEVNGDGTIGNVKVLRGVCPLLDEEAVRVIKNMPRWKPAYQIPGQPVRSPMRLPVKFTLQ